MKGKFEVRVLALSLGAAVAFAGCFKEDTPPPPPDEKPTEDVVEPLCDPGPAPLRRLTRTEYNNTIHALLGDASNPADSFPTEEESLGFNNNAESQSVSPVLAERLMVVAEEVALRAVADVDALLGCDVAAQGEEACVRGFIAGFGERAFRRPMAQADVDAFYGLFAAARLTDDLDVSLAMVLQALLQSPEFLYRLEWGTPAEGRPGIMKLDDYEVATRLSYFIWGSMPDEALFDAARAGLLQSPEGIAVQAERMLADPRAKETIREFHRQWLGLGKIDDVAKDEVAFPTFNPDVRPLLRAEAEALIDDVLWNGPGDLKTLLTAPYTFRNGELAAHYGEPGPGGAALQKVTLPDGRAVGVLSQGGLMAVLAKPDQSSPIHRGKFVREQLMCQAIPPPPDNVELVPPEPDPNATTRDRFAQHRADPSCAACHNMMDPVGFGFEKLDGVGRFRTTENGLPIDDSGEVFGSDMGTFVGLKDLGHRLADSPEVHQCMARQWFRFAHGRSELLGDQCTVDELTKTFTESGLSIRSLITAITQTQAFRFRPQIDSSGGTP